MKTQKIAITLLLSVTLSGCLFNKNNEKPKTKNKKVALAQASKGMPVAEASKFFDEGVEAFVLDEENINDEMVMAQAEVNANWKTDDAFDKEKLEPIYFNFDSSDVRKDQAAKLAFNVEQARDIVSEGAALCVSGHSDSHFISETYNIAKSEARARVVADELVKAGIPQENIKVVAYGDKQPAVMTHAKEEKNRRAMITKLTREA